MPFHQSKRVHRTRLRVIRRSRCGLGGQIDKGFLRPLNPALEARECLDAQRIGIERDRDTGRYVSVRIRPAVNRFLKAVPAPCHRRNDVAVVQFPSNLGNDLRQAFVADKNVWPNLIEEVCSRQNRTTSLGKHLQQTYRAR